MEEARRNLRTVVKTPVSAQQSFINVWRSQNNTWVRVPDKDINHFVATQCYVTHLVTYTDDAGDKIRSWAYFWQGGSGKDMLSVFVAFLNAGTPFHEISRKTTKSTLVVCFGLNKVVVITTKLGLGFQFMSFPGNRRYCTTSKIAPGIYPTSPNFVLQ